MAGADFQAFDEYGRKYAKFRHLVFDLTATSAVASSDVLNPGLFPAHCATESASAAAGNRTAAIIGSDGLITISATGDTNMELYIHVWATNNGVPDGSSADLNADGSLTANAIRFAKHRYGRFKHRASEDTLVGNGNTATVGTVPYAVFSTGGAIAWEGDSSTEEASFSLLANTSIANVPSNCSGVVHWWSTNGPG